MLEGLTERVKGEAGYSWRRESRRLPKASMRCRKGTRSRTPWHRNLLTTEASDLARAELVACGPSGLESQADGDELPGPP